MNRYDLKSMLPLAAKCRTVFVSAAIFLGFVALFFFFGCAKKSPPLSKPGLPKPYRVGGQWYQPLAHATDFRQRGVASWYGKDFHGKRTSNGEIYDMHALTAAHKTLPLGVVVRVKNLKNNRSLDVRINDRGPFVRGRIIDLSYEAAKRLGILGPGLAPVEIVALGAPLASEKTGNADGQYIPMDYYTGNFTVQVGAFQVRENAESLKNRLKEKYLNAHITTYFNGRNTFYRVRVGRYMSLEDVMAAETHFISLGFKGAFAVAE